MTYNETIEYLYNATPVFQKVGAAAYKPGLETTISLDHHFNNPHRSYKTIHVGGTNGKGSVSHTLAAILQSAGYRVGLYTSPHLVDFRERIRVNGEMMERQYVIDFVENHRSFFEQLSPSFFELTMMMAFCYFKAQKVDFAIIEVGLGGRLDSTNIINPLLSIITNISKDHVQFLGDTLEQIASEKAGIIKPHTPIVIGEIGTTEIKTIFEAKALSEQAPIFFAEEETIIKAVNHNGDGLEYSTEEYPQLIGSLGGLAQIKNTATLLTAIRQLKTIGLNIPEEAVRKGFKEVISLTGLMGRWQIISHSPRIICDTGHNVGGVQYIVEQLKQEHYDSLHIVIGMVNDKDITAVLALLPREATYYFTKASIPRALNEVELATEANKFELKGNTYATVEQAIAAAKEELQAKDLLFIGGSNFVIAEALEYFNA